MRCPTRVVAGLATAALLTGCFGGSDQPAGVDRAEPSSDATGGPGCAPASIRTDHAAGLLTDDEAAEYAYYAMAPFMPPPAPAAAGAGELPERYRLCDDPNAFQMLSIEAAIYVDAMDPTRRDALWVAITGVPYVVE